MTKSFKLETFQILKMSLFAALFCPLMMSILTTQYVSGLFLPLEHLESPCGEAQVGGITVKLYIFLFQEKFPCIAPALAGPTKLKSLVYKMKVCSFHINSNIQNTAGGGWVVAWLCLPNIDYNYFYIKS